MSWWLIPLVGGPVWAARITVDAAGSGDHADVQDAVDAAVPGDYIVVEPGTYGPALLEGWVGPVVSSGGAAETALVGSKGSPPLEIVADPGTTLTVHGLTLASGGGEDGLVVDGASLTAWDLVIQDARASVKSTGGATVDLEAATVLGATSCSLCADGGELTARQVTLVDGQYHLLVGSGSGLAVEQLIAYDAFGVGNCGSGAMTVSYSLFAEYGGSPIAACMTTDHLLLDFDPAFVAWSDDGDWSNDDFSLADDSYLIDAGDPACVEPDDTTCDLGATGGERANAADTDGDGLDDDWEFIHGTDWSSPDDADDPDGDGLDNLGEFLFGTDPLDDDSDDDGADDLLELQVSLDPLDGTDQAPTAVLSADAVVAFVGDTITLDASGSTDPAGQALSYRWSFSERPDGTGVTALGMAGATPSFDPDVAGLWVAVVTVDDGTWTAEAEVSVYVHGDTTISVPGDFAELEEALLHLTDGMQVTLGAGSWEVDGVLTHDVTLVGQGRTDTELAGSLVVDEGARVRLADLALTCDGCTGTLIAFDAAWLTLYRVDVRASAETGILLYDATLTGLDLSSLAGGSALVASNSHLHLAHAHLESTATRALYLSDSTTHLEGVTVEALDDAIWATDGAVALAHVTAWTESGSDNALYANRVDLHIRNSWLGQPGGSPLSCSNSTDVDIAYVAVPDGTSATCEGPIARIEDPTSLQPGLGLDDSSPARGAGDVRDADADRVRPDLGAWDGRAALGTTVGPEDPWADDDDDGLPAVVEWVLETSDAAWDSDGDGQHDLTELLDGDDPADPYDRLHPVTVTHARVDPGDDAVLGVSFDEDGSCGFSWADGEGANPRTEPTQVAGTWSFEWTLTCGDGALTGAAMMLVTETLAVPGDAGTLAEALDLAEDHHHLVLADGVHSGPVDLRGTWTALSGTSAETRLVGDLWTGEGPVTDLRIEGDLVSVDADVTRVIVQDGSWWGHDGRVRNVLVDGLAATLHDIDARNLTVDGDLHAEGSLVASAVTGSLRARLDTSWRLYAGDVTGTSVSALIPGAFILEDDDPEVAILAPWPGSVLWDGGDTSVEDVDGSPEDAGHTGGPLAWPVDADQDGLNDAWEALHGVSEPTEDPDEDHADNAWEWEHGTDPNDPDTDDDGLLDALDPEPLVQGEAPVQARLHVDVTRPQVGETLTATAVASSVAAGLDLTYEWELIRPVNANEQLRGDGDTVTLTVDAPGTWWLTVTAWAADFSDSATVQIHTWDEVVVPEDAELQDFVDLVGSGTVLILEKDNYKGSLRVDKDLTIRSAGGTLDASIDGTQGAATVQVSGGAHLRLEAVTLWVESGYPGVEIWDGSRVSMDQVRMVGGDTSFRIYDGHFDGESFFALGARAMLELVDGSFTARNAVLGYPDPDARTALSLASGVVRIESAILDWRPEDSTWRTPIACMSDEQPCDYQVSFYRTLTPSAQDVLAFDETRMDVTYGAPEFLLDPWDAEHLGAADLRLDHDSPARDAGSPHTNDADGSPTDIGVFGGPRGNWIDVDNDRDGFTEREGDCDDLDPEVLGDPLQECDGRTGCSTGPGSPSPGWLLGLLGCLTRRRRSR